MRLHTSSLVLTALFLAACADKAGTAKTDTAAPVTTASAASAGSASGSSADSDLADVQNYHLTMDKVDKFLAAQRNLALRMKDMSPEEREAIKARADADDSNDDSMEDMQRKIEAEPALASAIRDAGLSPREYTVLTISMMQSAMAAGVLKMRPKDNQDSLVREMKANIENVRFMQQNEAELQRKQKALADEMQRLGIPTEG